MKLIVLGANGRTGEHVLRQAIERGADVTAVVRSEGKRPPIEHDRLRVVVGDPCDPDFLIEVLRGHDAVVSTLGGRLPTKAASAVYPLSAEAIVSAARASGMERVVVTSSALIFPSRRMLDRILKLLVRSVVRNATKMEQVLLAADLDVTVARCGFLNDDEQTEYRASPDALPKDGSSVSRRSLASFLVDTVHGTWSGQHVYGVSGPNSSAA